MKYKKIPLTKGKFALISEEDFERVNQFKWCASQESKNGLKWYAIRRVQTNGKSVKIRMHRLIMGLGTGLEDPRIVHHKNDDGLDNRRENLEILNDNLENMAQSPGWVETMNRKPSEEPFL